MGSQLLSSGKKIVKLLVDCIFTMRNMDSYWVVNISLHSYAIFIAWQIASLQLVSVLSSNTTKIFTSMISFNDSQRALSPLVDFLPEAFFYIKRCWMKFSAELLSTTWAALLHTGPPGGDPPCQFVATADTVEFILHDWKKQSESSVSIN